MKRLIATLAVTTAFAAAPAVADHHMKDGEMMDHDMKSKSWTTADEDALTAQKATQVFLAIDVQNDGLITENEWARWQNRSQENLMQFSDYDADGDGDIELSEYLETYDE